MNHRLLIVFLACWIPLGCSKSPEEQMREKVLNRAAIRLNPQTLDAFVGTYRLPSGALFHVIRQGDRLLAGTPPHELLAQNTRRFKSNRLPGEFHFEGAEDGSMQRMNHRLAKVDHWADRVDPRTAADPARMVDAGGHRLRMLVTGEGRPTIVLEDGFGSGIELQAILQAKLSSLAKVVTYDHAGTGGSDPGPQPRDGKQVAQELHVALANAGLEPPFLFVGASIGAEYIQIYSHEFPDEVAALVLLDPPPDWDAMFAWAAVHSPSRVASYRKLYDEMDRGMDELMRVQEPARNAEWLALDVTRQQARESLPIPAKIPVVQITGSTHRQFSFVMDDKVRFFDESLRTRIPQARHVLADKSGHAVSYTDSNLVIEEIRRLICELTNQSG